MMNHSDIDWALHQIEQMVRIARRSTDNLKPSKDIAYRLLPVDQQESLDYALGDILDKVTALKDELSIDERTKSKQSAAAGARPPDSAQAAWEDVVGDTIRDATSMAGITAELAGKSLTAPELERLLFATHQVQKMLEDLKNRYDRMDIEDAGHGAVVGATH